jgi:hypothetical protein
MSDGRFAVLGGSRALCEVLVKSRGRGRRSTEHWEPLPRMHDPRHHLACEAVAGSIIVAGRYGRKSAEVYDEVLGRCSRVIYRVG